MEKKSHKCTAKGVKRNVIQTLTMQRYKDCIYGNTKEQIQQMVEFNLIRSTNHKVNTIKVKKIGLCATDDKRYILPDNVTSYAHGHYMIPLIEEFSNIEY